MEMKMFAEIAIANRHEEIEGSTGHLAITLEKKIATKAPNPSGIFCDWNLVYQVHHA